MSQSADHSRNYTTADIQQYLDGKMDASEMHAFEKAMMDDPFLADAMEGLQETQLQFGQERFTNELQQLEQQLEKRVAAEKAAPVVPITGFKWWKLAAAAVVIIVAGVFAFNSYFNGNEQKENPIALLDKKTDSIAVLDSSTSTANLTVPDTIARGTEKAAPTFNYEYKKEDNTTSPDKNKPVVASESKEIKKLEVTSDAPAPSAAVTKDIDKPKEELAVLRKTSESGISRNDTAKGNNGGRSAEIVADNDDRQKNAPAANNKSKSFGFNNTYKGLLISPENKPIANAELFINQKEKANTDANGYFSFYNKDTQVSVTVNSPGFKARNFTLKNNYAFNELQIEPSSQSLNETVIINKKPARERANAFLNYPKVMVQDAEPIKGWIDFENYIEANRKNIQHLDSKSGDVVISFIVNAQGALSSFKVEQSLTDAQDEEAVRLIKSGPAWHLLKGKKARVVVIIRF